MTNQARVFAKALSAALGQPVPVVNHKGGGGAVGGSRLKNSAPDGHTILMGGDDIASYIPLVSEVDFAYEDFRFLAAVAEYQNAMYAKKGAPFTTFAELAEYAKSNPGIRLAHVGGITKPFIDHFVAQSGIEAKVIVIGVVIGIVMGVLPGVGSLTAIPILIPVTDDSAFTIRPRRLAGACSTSSTPRHTP